MGPTAVEMAEIARERGRSPFVERLADDIIRMQRQEIATLRCEQREIDAMRQRLGRDGRTAGSHGSGHSGA